MDGISPALLKHIKHEISKPVSLILNQCLTTGIFPHKLKIAKVVPIYIYKSDDENIFNNYRPIYILPALSKVFEKIVLDLSEAFDTLNHDILIHKLQYCGASVSALRLFKNYFTGRKQYVVYNVKHVQNLVVYRLEFPKVLY